MFSGIVEELARVVAISASNDGATLCISSKLDISDSNIGDSICINGVCLTVISRKNNEVIFELAPETLRRSTLGELKEGDSVNLERSLKLGDRLHGHFVFGHVDGVSKIHSKKIEGNSTRLQIAIPTGLARYIIPKGSISVSGVSLTIGEVEQGLFSVYIVPHTVSVTTLGLLEKGSSVNLEIDMLARYALSER